MARLDDEIAARPQVDREALIRLAHDLPAVWNAVGTDARAKQRLVRLLIEEIVVDLDDVAYEAALVIPSTGGTGSAADTPRCGYDAAERVAIRAIGSRAPSQAPGRRHPQAGRPVDRSPAGRHHEQNALQVVGRPDLDRPASTGVRVAELRNRMGVAAFDPLADRPPTISADAAAERLGICIGSVHKLIKSGTLPATQLMPSAPWQIPLAALDSEPVRIGIKEIADRRPTKALAALENRTLRLPGL